MAIGWTVGQHMGRSGGAGGSSARASLATSSSSSFQPPAPIHADREMGELVALLGQTLRASRPVLLGSRDPRGPSCVTVVKRGEIQTTLPAKSGDADGGPGTELAMVHALDHERITTPMQDYAWHQTRLRTLLENKLVLNRPALDLSRRLAERARDLAAAADAWTTWPVGLEPEGFDHTDDWPSYCVSKLDHAVAVKDLAATRQWAGELASATLSLADLHQWLAMLAENHLRALDFQRRCQTLFESAQAKLSSYDPESTISAFPAGILSLNCDGNYFEVERQAERLFTMPPDRLKEIAVNEHLTPGSLWVYPGVRECYLKLQGALSSENRATWDRAARTPYEHSYLCNMLFRAARADASDYLCRVLKKFDANHPHASVGELMSVLMYRGHSFGGLEWSDRFQPELLAAADAIAPNADDLDALMSAWRWTHQFYRGPGDGYGWTFTLRDALQQHKLDCVRATDMIAAIFRNSGRPRFGHVRWCAETNAHSVAAYLAGQNGQRQTLVVDGLQAPGTPEVWPDCYFHGHAWPAGMEGSPTPYAAELYVRGLDNYVWAEGYIVRGPNAGELMTARIPYSTHRLEDTDSRVFAGPYPR
jgi:hypothetical protein